MRKLSTAFKDRTMSPLRTAVYWIEYAMRTNGASHMKSESSRMSFYRYSMMDIVPPSLFAILIYLYFSFKLQFKIYMYLKRKFSASFNAFRARFSPWWTREGERESERVLFAFCTLIYFPYRIKLWYGILEYAIKWVVCYENSAQKITPFFPLRPPLRLAVHM